MTISFKVSDKIKPQIIKFYADSKREKTPPYAVFQADSNDTVVTLYESGKIVFQGVSADIDAQIWKDLENRLNKDELPDNFDKYSTIGSDEVGTGDYFGPIVVCATYVSKEKTKYLRELKVNDSKKLTDEYIKEIAPKLVKEIPYSAFILTNNDYNNLNHDLINMNKIKAILHNKVLTNLKDKNLEYDFIVVDQFTSPKSYFNYLFTVPSVVKDITFTTKAEGKCLSVACASIISRYIFLKEMDKMSKELGKEIPKGAGEDVDKFAKDIIKDKNITYLTKYVKLNFKNTSRISN